MSGEQTPGQAAATVAAVVLALLGMGAALLAGLHGSWERTAQQWTACELLAEPGLVAATTPDGACVHGHIMPPVERP